MKKLLLVLGFSILSISVDAQVTFSEHIAPIIYDNCTACHRSGEIAPFSLTNYEEVANWSGMIQYVTEIKYMPPWKPDQTYSNFVGESGLSDDEIQLISDWVAAGSPQGNPSLEPPIPNFPSGSQLGTPDLVLEMTEDYFIAGNNQDDYRVFVLPTGLSEDKEIAAIEFRPGNNKAVHHALIAYETAGAAAAMDAQTPEYGYEAFGDFGVTPQGIFTGYTPGIKTIRYPVGIGTTLPADADLLIQLHYAPLPNDQTDRSLVNIFFKDNDDPIEREIERIPITPFDLVSGWFSFVIDPDEVITFHGTEEVEQDISLINVYPHCHYLGKDWEIFAVTPQNDTINIIRIEEWDFNWQGSYTFDRMKKIPAGSIIHTYTTYDNTTSNPYNPSNPTQTVSWGEGTTDEMFLVGMGYVPYQEGDEDIIIGEGPVTSATDLSISSGNLLYPPFPNPSNGEVALSYYLEQSEAVRIELFDMKGVLVKTIMPLGQYPAGNHKIEFSVDQLPSGVYTIRMSNTETVLTELMMVAE